VAQELSIIDELSVAENVFLGDGAAGLIRSRRGLAQRAHPYLERLGLGAVDPAREAGTLSVAERQLVEIARLRSRAISRSMPAGSSAAPARSAAATSRR
jgi:ABC-type sugar transport system ATPase subunit